MPTLYIPTTGTATGQYMWVGGTTSASTAFITPIDRYGTTGSRFLSTSTASTIIVPYGSQVYTGGTAITSTFTSGTGDIYWTSNYDAAAWTPPSPAYLKRKRIESDQRVMRARGAIKRALKLMDNVGFGDDIRIFLNGDSIEVSHPDSMLKFILSKRKGQILHYTMHTGHMIPYHLELYTKTDVHVANLCVYFEETPVLDQVFAVTMFIRTGDEEHLLKTANWSSVNIDEDVREQVTLCYPMLASKFPKPRPGRVWTPEPAFQSVREIDATPIH